MARNQAELDKLMDELRCVICKEDFTETGPRRPMTTNCSHTLCDDCLSVVKDCPTCRTTITSSQRNLDIGTIRRLIDVMSSQLEALKAMRRSAAPECGGADAVMDDLVDAFAAIDAKIKLNDEGQYEVEFTTLDAADKALYTFTKMGREMPKVWQFRRKGPDSLHYTLDRSDVGNYLLYFNDPLLDMGTSSRKCEMMSAQLELLNALRAQLPASIAFETKRTDARAYDTVPVQGADWLAYIEGFVREGSIDAAFAAIDAYAGLTEKGHIEVEFATLEAADRGLYTFAVVNRLLPNSSGIRGNSLWPIPFQRQGPDSLCYMLDRAARMQLLRNFYNPQDDREIFSGLSKLKYVVKLLGGPIEAQQALTHELFKITRSVRSSVRRLKAFDFQLARFDILKPYLAKENGGGLSAGAAAAASVMQRIQRGWNFFSTSAFLEELQLPLLLS